jgi:hypothetical protein
MPEVAAYSPEQVQKHFADRVPKGSGSRYLSFPAPQGTSGWKNAPEGSSTKLKLFFFVPSNNAVSALRVQHRYAGGKKFVQCLGSECPICEAYRRYPDDKRIDVARPQKRYFFNVINLDMSPDEHINPKSGKIEPWLFEVSPKLYRSIQGAMGVLEADENPFSLVNGRAFILQRTQGKGINTEYTANVSGRPITIDPAFYGCWEEAADLRELETKQPKHEWVDEALQSLGINWQGELLRTFEPKDDRAVHNDQMPPSPSNPAPTTSPTQYQNPFMQGQNQFQTGGQTAAPPPWASAVDNAVGPNPGLPPAPPPISSSGGQSSQYGMQGISNQPVTPQRNPAQDQQGGSLPAPPPIVQPGSIADQVRGK